MVKFGIRLYRRNWRDIQRPTNHSFRKSAWKVLDAVEGKPTTPENSPIASSYATSKESHTTQPNNIGLRRSTRTKQPPVWHNLFCYVISLKLGHAPTLIVAKTAKRLGYINILFVCYKGKM